MIRIERLNPLRWFSPILMCASDFYCIKCRERVFIPLYQLLGHNFFLYCKNVLCKQIIFAEFATSRKNSEYWCMEVVLWICLAYIVYLTYGFFGKLDLSIRTWYFLSSNVPHNMLRIIITNLTWCLFYSNQLNISLN